MFRTLYGPRDEEQLKGIQFSEPTMTDQSFADECDINRIISRYKITGVLDSPGATDRSLLQYGDATLCSDLQMAYGMVTQATDEFAALPAEVRRAFDDDPMQLVTAFQDPSQISKLQELGLVEKSEPTPQPQPEPTPQPQPSA